MSFHCPTCGSESKVVLTRPANGQVRRRHRCAASRDHAFTTVQLVVPDYARVTLTQRGETNGLQTEVV